MRILAIIALAGLCGCVATRGVHSNVTTVYGMQLKTPTIGNVPGIVWQLGIVRNENLDMSGSNTFNSATHVSDTGLFRPVIVDRTINATSSDVQPSAKP